MADPPNPGRANYYNVYIHHNADDDYPNEWAQVILDAKASLKITLSVRFDLAMIPFCYEKSSICRSNPRTTC